MIDKLLTQEAAAEIFHVACRAPLTRWLRKAGMYRTAPNTPGHGIVRIPRSEIETARLQAIPQW